jgi:hypothetical protein
VRPGTISVKVFPDVFQFIAGQVSMGDLGGLPLLSVRDVALRGWKLTLKWRGRSRQFGGFGAAFV